MKTDQKISGVGVLRSIDVHTASGNTVAWRTLSAVQSRMNGRVTEAGQGGASAAVSSSPIGPAEIIGFGAGVLLLSVTVGSLFGAGLPVSTADDRRYLRGGCRERATMRVAGPAVPNGRTGPGARVETGSLSPGWVW